MKTTLRPASGRRLVSSAFRCLALVGASLLLFAAGSNLAVAQNFYVGNFVNNTAGRYDANTGAANGNPFVSGLTRPVGTAATGNTLYVANSTGGAVTAHNATTGAPAAGFGTISAGNPFDVATAGDLLYVSFRAGNTVAAYNAATGTAAPGFTPITTDLNGPTGLVVADGILYVANRTALTIRTYNAQTGALINPSFITGVNTQFLAVAGNTLYVSQSSSINTVSAFDLSTGTAAAGFTTITGLGAPQGMKVVGNNLFVNNYSTSAVRQYDATTGALINPNFITGLSGPYGLALTVPEPSTWAMLTAGSIFLVGFVLFRQRVRQAQSLSEC